MKKNLITVLIVCFLTVIPTVAEEFKWNECWQNYGGTVQEGNFIVKLGLGLSTYVFNDLSEKTDWRTPYFETSVEYTKKIWLLPFGFGGYFGYSGYGWKAENYEGGYYVKSTASRNYINFGALVNYHVKLPIEKLDVYTGIRTGIQIRHDNVDIETNIPYQSGKQSNTDTNTYFDFNYRLGATYFFTKLIGVNVETGYPVFLNASLSLKF